MRWAKLMKKIHPAVSTFLAVAISFVVQPNSWFFCEIEFRIPLFRAFLFHFPLEKPHLPSSVYLSDPKKHQKGLQFGRLRAADGLGRLGRHGPGAASRPCRPLPGTATTVLLLPGTTSTGGSNGEVGYNPSSKWDFCRVNPLITGVITHLLSGMSHQVIFSDMFWKLKVSELLPSSSSNILPSLWSSALLVKLYMFVLWNLYCRLYCVW